MTPRDEIIESHNQQQDSRLMQVIHAELQDLITQAADIRKQITTAKTTTKKKYFEKKFAKISTDVRQMIAAMDQLKWTNTKPIAENAPVEVETVADENA